MFRKAYVAMIRAMYGTKLMERKKSQDYVKANARCDTRNWVFSQAK